MSGTQAARPRATAPVPPGRIADTTPAQMPFAATARILFSISGAVAAIGIITAMAVPVLGLSSGDCGAIDCLTIQSVGKAATAGGAAVAALTISVISLMARRYSAAVLALLIAIPAFLWTATIPQLWHETATGTGLAGRIVTTAEEYVASQEGIPAEQVRGVIWNGRDNWISVRIREPAAAAGYVLVRGENGDWTAQAHAPSFSKDELRAIGAPTDLLRDPG